MMAPDTTVPLCEGICGPAAVDAPATPPADDCLPAGQTRWSMQPCEFVAVTGTPLALAARLPETGATTDVAAIGVCFVVVGLVFVYVKRWRS